MMVTVRSKRAVLFFCIFFTLSDVASSIPGGECISAIIEELEKLDQSSDSEIQISNGKLSKATAEFAALKDSINASMAYVTDTPTCAPGATKYEKSVCENGHWVTTEIPDPSCLIECPHPFTKVNGGECFYMSKDSEATNWDNARNYCINIGGDLATPANVPLLREYLGEINMPIAVWIGAHDRLKPGHWQYLNGQPIKASDWSTSHGVNQPDNLGREQCLEIRRYFTPPVNNYYCHMDQGFVCQFGAPGCLKDFGC